MKALSESRESPATSVVDEIIRRHYPTDRHPYRMFEQAVHEKLPAGGVIVDAGCGRHAEVLLEFSQRARLAVGLDMVDCRVKGVSFIRTDLTNIPLPDNFADVVMSRSVFEHLEHPAEVYRELNRILKPGGHLIFLTPNRWSYTSLGSSLVPNRWHPLLVRLMNGRDEADTFATHYRTNSPGAIRRLARNSGFGIDSIEPLKHYPYCLVFSPTLFRVAVMYDRIIGSREPFRWLRPCLLSVLRKQPGRANSAA
jgi:SAM-dependent methyltransferase